MATTVPQTTRSSTTYQASASNASSGSSCDIYVPDYSVLRQENLDKINDYYQSLLSSYTTTYNQYARDSRGTKSDQNYANTVLLPKYKNYNDQIINLTQTVINGVNQDMDLVSAQKDELTSKSRQVDTIMNNISLLKEKDNEMTILTGARQQSLTSSNEGLDEMNFSTYIFIGINVFFLLVVLGLVFYIVYSSFTGSNSNKTKNNLYANIAVNRST
jgi:hypothetical protein